MLSPTPTRNRQIDAYVDGVDDGASAGYVEFYTTGMGLLLATLTFSINAFGVGGAVNPGEAIAAAITGESSAVAGAAAEFFVYDSDAVLQWSGSIGTSGADINLNSVDFQAGATVDVTSWKVTQPA